MYAVSVWPNDADRLPATNRGPTFKLVRKALGGEFKEACAAVVDLHEGSARQLRDGIWVLAGQRSLGYAAPWLIHAACADLVRQVQSAGHSHLVMGLPGTGSSGLPRKVVLDAVLHAIGEAHDPERALAVEICVPVNKKDPFSPNLAADALDGRIDVAGPLRRGKKGVRLLHVVYEITDPNNLPGDVLASVLVENDSTLESLGVRLPGLPSIPSSAAVELHPPESVKNSQHPDAGPTSELSRATDQLVVELKFK
jgi:hypothetical protein